MKTVGIRTKPNNRFSTISKKGNKGNPVVAMPTGTGKSVVISNFIKKAFHLYPRSKMMMLTHVKELIEQNGEKMVDIWPQAPLGYYSAGLGSKCSFASPLIFGGVQSVSPAIKKDLKTNSALAGFPHFGHRDLLLIDECHLLSPNDDTTYQFVYNELLKVNPHLKVIGFTATPYRLKQGMITDGGVFTDICYDLTTIDNFNRLIAEGYLAPLIPRPTNTQIDVSNVGITAGEYNNKQLQAAVDDDETTFAGVKEMCELGSDRGCWLVFAAGVKNAEKDRGNVELPWRSCGCGSFRQQAKEERRNY